MNKFQRYIFTLQFWSFFFVDCGWQLWYSNCYGLIAIANAMLQMLNQDNLFCHVASEILLLKCIGKNITCISITPSTITQIS